MDLSQRLKVLLVEVKPAIACALLDRPELALSVLSSPQYLKKLEVSACASALAGIPYPSGGKLRPSAILSVRRAIVQFQPDLVHAFYPRALAHTLSATLGMKARPKIISYRGVTAPAPWWSPEQWLTYRSSRVDAHACESGAVSDALVQSGVPRERCSVVYNCLNQPVQTIERASARAAWGVPASSFVVALAANMRPVKGADVLLRAALECLDLTDVHWVLMGRVYDPRVKRLAADPRLKNVVHLVGHLPKASSLIGAADVFVMPSRAEALSVALLEAMASDVCPVVSDAGGMKEAVRDGQDGLVFPSGDSQALAQCIRRLRHDDALRLQSAASAKQRIADEFSPAAVAARLVTLYQQVVGASKRAAGDVRRAA